VILIIAGPGDAHSEIVARRLREKGAACSIFDLREVPAASVTSAWVDGSRPLRARLRRDSGEPRELDLGAVETVWFRRPALPLASPTLEPEDREFAQEESLALLLGLATALRGRFWVNPVVAALATDRGLGKLGQLDLAREHGLAIPRTLATNDPDAAREFVRSCPEGAIYKPFKTPTRTHEAGERREVQAVFTNRVDASALEDVDQVRHAPCIFQELVPKSVELRVVVLGSKVFACEIHSQEDERSRVDFRRDAAAARHLPHELPEAIAKKLVALNHALGLVFGAVDLILTPAGEYVFLENNQQGQFLWLEELAGLPLLESFCEMLIQASPDFACDARNHAPGLPR
jgi:hypothetical protein